MHLKLLLVVLILTLVRANDDVEKLFREYKIIPDVLDTAPKDLLKVEYPGNLLVGMGKEFTPTQTKDEPHLVWVADPNEFYTIYMGNPDAPFTNDPYWSEWLHWLVVNVPGLEVNKGEIICPYMGPLAPKASGIMRYAFLVYKQPKKLRFIEPHVNNTSADPHKMFHIKEFGEKYQLGEPIAGNVYRSQWDEFVKVLHKQLNVAFDDN
uniref:Odorant-binding protein A5 n=1 Tax=Glossina pallidipes TaxID=7398 RepID=A0A1A9ZJB8_GLOPL